MVQVKGKRDALHALGSSLVKSAVLFGGGGIVLAILYGSCTATVLPNELGVEQVRFGSKSGVGDRTFESGLYFVGPGTTMHTFSREIHLLEASDERTDAKTKARDVNIARRVDYYFEERDRILGSGTHRRIGPLNVQTSDGYAVACDVSLLYAIADPVKIAREFGWGTLYVDGFVINTFRNGVLATLGKMSAEEFYNEGERIKAVAEAEAFLRERFADRGFKVEKLLLRAYSYSETYEKSLQDKKVAVQLTEKAKKVSLVNEERAKLQQLESKGQAAITIAESEINAQIAKVRAEAELYSAQTHAKADQEVGLASAEAKRLKAEALALGNGRGVVALQMSTMFDNIDAAVMTPEQYVAFVRNAWALIGVGGPQK